ncbi:MAG: NAD(P)H-dependent oxidoreductase [Pseudomonadales bacterium]|nr:NAD(P)H-dependent oxidoreductase [Pseudomonadales bacterium]
MKKVLRLHTSLFKENSVSSQLVQELTESLADRGDTLDIVDRDFRESPIPHLDAERLQALSTAKDERSAKQTALVDYSDSLIEEVQEADVLIIALPMYNFSVPSMFKAWFDHVARAGVTFAYTEQGPKGLLEGKKAYLVSAMGGSHEPGQTDFLRPYVKLLMNFVGIEDVEFVTARGLNMADDVRQQGIEEARADIERLVIQHSNNHQPTEEVAA